MLRFLGACVERIFVFSGAIICMQAPQFYHAYTQRLAGHLDELQLQLASLSSTAQASGRSLQQYVDKFTSHSDPDIAQQGDFMRGMVDRFQTLNEAYSTMLQSSTWSRPFHFMQHLQWDIATATQKDFQFGLSLTMEGAVYALVGMGLGYAIYVLIRAPMKLARRRRA